MGRDRYRHHRLLPYHCGRSGGHHRFGDDPPRLLSGSRGDSFEPYRSLITRDTAGNILSVDDFNTNLRQIRTSGIDFALRYALPTPAGRFGVAFNGTWLAFFDRDQDHAPTIHGKGTYDLGALPELKFNTGLNWALAGWNVGVLGRFVGSFKECSSFDSDSRDYLSPGGLCWLDPAAPSRSVGANFVTDLNLGYTFSTGVGRTTLMAGVSNVFDKAPQFVYAAPLANSDPSIYDYVGRFFYTRLQHRF